MVACKQLPVLWCQTIQIFNTMIEGFWVQASTYGAVVDQDGIDLSKRFGLNVSQCLSLASPWPRQSW